MGKRMNEAFDIMRERNRRYLEEQKKKDGENPDKAAESPAESPAESQTELQTELEEAEEKARAFHEEEIKLEKGDVPAMILSAILVFGPIFLVLIGLMILAWVLLH